MVMLLVKDKSTINLLNPVKLLVYSCEGVCKSFFNDVYPSNLYLDKNKARLQKIEMMVREMFKFNTVIEGVVEK